MRLIKKVICISFVCFLITGCYYQKNESIKKIDNSPSTEEVQKIPEYTDNNPIKIAFYKGTNGVYTRIDKFESHVEDFKEIGIFSIILSNDEKVYGNSMKSLYKNIGENIENFSNYKIGYNLKFTLEDGKVINENILKPLDYGSYPFSNYLYAWLYDDINTTGWHSHIEENEFNDNTVMSSIKLMWAPGANLISSNIELTVFTYDEDDFDIDENYRGISKFTTIIERS